MKTCTKCKESKPRSEFHNCASKRDGKFSACKKCRNAYNNSKAAEVGHAELYRRAVERDPEYYKQRSADYYKANREKIKARTRAWSEANRERKIENRKRHYSENKETYIQSAAEWAAENRSRRSEICRNYIARMREDNPSEFIPAEVARRLLARVISSTGKKKTGRTFSVIGYNKQQFAEHMESMFEHGMSWSNHGEWHVDHIIPVSELVRCGVTDPAKINALENLRPMWAKDNMSKGANFALAPPTASFITRAAR